MTFPVERVMAFHDGRRPDLLRDFLLARLCNFRTNKRRTAYFKYASILLPVQVAIWSVLLLSR